MGSARGSILIVDDEPQLIAIMQRYLERMGFDVETAGTTAAAWGKIEADPGGYVMAVVDMSMTGIGGAELCRRILAASPRLRAIASSGYPTDVQALETAAPGRVVFLHKPFTPEMLADAVRTLLGD